MSRLAFIFDLDGVITDTAIYHYQAWKRLAERIGVSFTHEDNEQLKGVSRRDSLLWIVRKGGLSFSEEELLQMMEEKNDDYKVLIEEIGEKDIFAGVRELIAQIKARGDVVGLASASKNARTIVQKLGIESSFDYIADAAKITNSKPAPDIFLDVMSAFNMQPQQCIGIEDAAAGVEAIKAAGMMAVGIGSADILHEAEIVFADIASLNLDEVLREHARQ